LDTAATIALSSISASAARSWSRRTSCASRSLPAASRTASLLTADAAPQDAWRVVERHVACDQLLTLRGKQCRRRDAKLRASECDHSLNDRHRVGGSSLI